MEVETHLGFWRDKEGDDVEKGTNGFLGLRAMFMRRDHENFGGESCCINRPQVNGRILLHKTKYHQLMCTSLKIGLFQM